MKKHAALLGLILLMGCSHSEDGDPSADVPFTDSNDNNGEDTSTIPSEPSEIRGTASVTGTVWMPGNNPSRVNNDATNRNHAIPVFGAIVYLSSFQPPDLQRNAVCTSCVLPTTPYALTAHDGSFTITSITAGLYWVVIEKAGFRRSFELSVSDDQEIVLSQERTTLPSRHDPLNGEEIPHIAVVHGEFDDLETLLAKLGIGELDAQGIFKDNQGLYDIYNPTGNEKEEISNLLMDIELMSQYSIIFFPCAFGVSLGEGLNSLSPVIWQNIREYIRRGGKMFVTDWSGEYVDNIFPEQMTFAAGIGFSGGGDSVDTPASAWNGTTWDGDQFGNANGDPVYNVHHAYAMDDDLRAWLTGQEGPLPERNESSFPVTDVGSINAEDFLIIHGWTQIQSLQSVSIGIDEGGQSVVDIPKVYVVGDIDGNPTSCPGARCQPMTVTFEPVGCGRVMYSTYHTTDNAHEGLIPQERILMYLMMELGECKSGPIID